MPSSDETAESVRRAQRALAELRQREVVEEQRANDEARDDELARWHTDTTATTDTGAATTSSATAASACADSTDEHVRGVDARERVRRRRAGAGQGAVMDAMPTPGRTTRDRLAAVRSRPVVGAAGPMAQERPGL